MEFRSSRMFLSCFLGLVTFWFLTGYADAVITPDSHIEADLKSLFTDPPHVKGYPYQDLLTNAASRYGLPLPLVLAVARGESFFDPKAKSAKGALGLMQVMPSTAVDYGLKPKDLLDPAKNIDVGVHYLADLYTRLKDPYMTLAAYYCGHNGADKKDTTLRSECDEYVRYIHTHLLTILAKAESETPVITRKVQHFVLARFDNFLDAKAFLGFLSRKLPELELDLLRHEIVQSDHIRYQYQILTVFEKDSEMDKNCWIVEKATGFSFCR